MSQAIVKKLGCLEEKLCQLINKQYCEYVKLYKKLPDFDGLVTENRWDNVGVANGTATTDAFGAVFLDAFDYSTPDSTSTVASLETGGDPIGTGGVQNVYTREAVVTFPNDTYLRATTNTEGVTRAEIGLDCGDLVTQFTHAHDLTTATNNTPSFFVPAGTHNIRFVVFDFGGTNATFQLEESVDDLTFTAVNAIPTGASVNSFALEKETQCILAKVCVNDGVEIVTDFITGEEIVKSEWSTCEPVTPQIIEIPFGIDLPNGATTTFPVDSVWTFTVSNEGTDPVVVTINGIDVTIHKGGTRTWGTGNNPLNTAGIDITTGANSNADVIWEV